MSAGALPRELVLAALEQMAAAWPTESMTYRALHAAVELIVRAPEGPVDAPGALAVLFSIEGTRLVLSFDRPVTFLGLEVDQARTLAQAIAWHANAIDRLTTPSPGAPS